MREASVDLTKNDKEKMKKIEQAKNKLLINQKSAKLQSRNQLLK